jgi:uncharacterized protein (TIGR03083 family)
MSGMRIEEHIAHVRAQGDRLVTLLTGADLASYTPTAPDWTLGELARHTGRVHRWAGTTVRDAVDHEPTDDEQNQWWGAMPADPEVVAWVRAGLDLLVGALTSAPPDLACWSFLPAPSPVAFWARRQAHETTIHRVDAEVAVTGTAGEPVPVEFAVDGVDELLLAFYGRPRNRVRSAEPRSLGLIAADADAAWLIRVTPEGAQNERVAPDVAAAADGTVSAPAHTLYIGVWNRGPLEPAGDSAALELWRQQAHIMWR